MSDAKIALDAVYGVKAGMTRVFDENGNHIPVTVIKIIPNLITQVKTTEKRKLNDWIYLVSQNGGRVKPKRDLNLELILKQLVFK